MANNWSAGLTEEDTSGLFPSTADQLGAMGLTPEQVLANPELLQGRSGNDGGARSPASTSAPVAMPETLAEDDVPGTGPTAQQAGTATQNAVTPTPAPASAPTATGPTIPGLRRRTTPPGASEPAPPDPTPFQEAMAGLAAQRQNAAAATAAANSIPTGDVELRNAMDRREDLQEPPQLYDPVTGKMKSQVVEKVYNPDTGKVEEVTVNPKPGVGSRIWRGVRGGLVGLATGGIPGALVGAIEPGLIAGGTAYGAPNSAWQKDEAQRNAQIGDANDDIKDRFAAWKQAVDASKARSTGILDTTKAYDRQTVGAKDVMDEQTKERQAATEQQRVEQESPEVKNKAAMDLSDAEYQQRKARIQAMPKGSMSTVNGLLYMLNGKVPDPRQPTEGEITAAAAARALVVFKAQHGGKGPQTLEDFNSIQQAARGQLGNGGGKVNPASEAEVSSIVAESDAEKEEFVSKYTQNPDGSYSLTSAPGDIKSMLSPQQMAAKLEGFRTKANSKLAKHNVVMNAQGELVQLGAGGQGGASSAPSIGDDGPWSDYKKKGN